MHQPLIPKRLTLWLLGATLVLPIAICVVVGVAALLMAMGDAVGGVVLRGIALGCGILWVVDLICLVLALAVRAVADVEWGEPDSPTASDDPEIGKL